MFVSIVIPCFNEADNAVTVRDNLLPVVHEMRGERRVEVVFVDDGSVDGTLEAFRGAVGNDPDIRIVRHENNLGLGAALRTGFASAHGDVIVTTDCDNTYRFGNIPRLLSALTPDVDLVTASPYHPDGGVDGVPAARLALSRACSAIYRSLTCLPLHTFTSLFRAHRRRVLNRIVFRSNGFSAVAEILVAAGHAGFRIVEVPLTLHARVAGVSKVRLLGTVLEHLRLLPRIVRRARNG